ncbi:MAG: PKD domain-containing protein, partial [Verrucomicrobia bacterium]|nr:PKD domain-containing protein [Verrucomicrobiota bacterium]
LQRAFVLSPGSGPRALKRATTNLKNRPPNEATGLYSPLPFLLTTPAPAMKTAALAAVTLALFAATLFAPAAPPQPTRTPLFRAVDLNIGETQDVTLADGSTARVKLLDLQETRDAIRDAVRVARVKVTVNGKPATLTSANYNLPLTVGGAQIDCPITKGCNSNSGEDSWGLQKDARLRLWPARSPWMEPGTFTYPLKQRWFASGTQMANEPCYVDGGEVPANKKIYYHDSLDFGGCEGMAEVVAATDGLVVSAAKLTLPGYEDTPVRPRGDVVYVLDDRGWYYRYSHLCEIDAAMRPGATVKMGQRIGLLGKEGASGGWSHLHFGIKSRQPSGKWGTLEAYAFAWESYLRQFAPPLIVVARPHHLIWAGDKATLDGTKSWSASGKIRRYHWTFTDGTTATGPTVTRRYTRPGTYSEILKVTDAKGAVAYDFAVVQVLDKAHPDRLTPSIQAAYAPSLDVRAGDPVTFKVRSFRNTHGDETWNFGDGTAPVTVRSDGCVKALAKDGFAVTTHRFAKPGDYIVRVERANDRGEKAITHLWVTVGPAAR